MSETVRRGLAACLVGITVLAGLLLGRPSSGAPQRINVSDLRAAQIARIENGLMPPVAIKGKPILAYKLTERMEHYKVPGVSVAFFERGQIVWARGYGYADVEHKTPVTAETLFQAASISKPVAALAALHLVDEGRLSLDDDVNAKLKSWKVPENEFTKEQKVTLRRLLTHSAGLTVHGFPGYASDERVPTVVQVLNGEKPANTAAVRVDTEPGRISRYSGGGFTVMQLLLTDVTGKAFPALMSELVLKPAGMTHSTYEQPLPKERATIATKPYRDSGEPVKGGPHTYPEMAAAGLWTTPSDLGRVAMEIEKEYQGESEKILTQAMARQYLTKQKTDWGLGVAVEGEGTALHFSHSGGNEGYRCFVVDFPARHQGVAIMTNSDSGGTLYGELLRAVAKEYGWPDYGVTEKAVVKVEAAVLASYAGEYLEPQAGKIGVTFKDGRLYVQAAPLGPQPQELFAESATQFFPLSSDVAFGFAVKEDKTVDSLVIKAGSQSFTAKRQK
jgi:CubicO group peptidase (beta-lactamase class C family)